MEVTEAMVAKIRSGDAISDKELNALIPFLEQLLHSLQLMGPAYGLPIRDVRRQLHMLDDFRRARERK